MTKDLRNYLIKSLRSLAELDKLLCDIELLDTTGTDIDYLIIQIKTYITLRVQKLNAYSLPYTDEEDKLWFDLLDRLEKMKEEGD